MPHIDLADFQRRHPQGHLVSAVIMPPRSRPHLHRLRVMMNDLMAQHCGERPFATALVWHEGLAELRCCFAHQADADLVAGLVGASAAPPPDGWSSHRSFELGAHDEVKLAGLLSSEPGHSP